MTFIIGQELRAHGSKFTNIKLIEQQGLDKIIKMVSEGNLVAPEPVGEPAERPGGLEDGREELSPLPGKSNASRVESLKEGDSKASRKSSLVEPSPCR